MTLLFRWNRYCSAGCFGEAHEDLSFDPSAIGAETFCLQLGKLAADAADLFVDCSPIEETQAYRGHLVPPLRIGVMSANAGETEPSIPMPSVGAEKNQFLTPIASPQPRQCDQARRPTRRVATIFSFRNPDNLQSTKLAAHECVSVKRVRRSEPRSCGHATEPTCSTWCVGVA